MTTTYSPAGLIHEAERLRLRVIEATPGAERAEAYKAFLAQYAQLHDADLGHIAQQLHASTLVCCQVQDALNRKDSDELESDEPGAPAPGAAREVLYAEMPGVWPAD